MEDLLYEAIIGGHTSEALTLLEASDVSKWINKLVQDGDTCLWWACRLNNKAVVTKMLKLKKIKINKAGLSGSTPLHTATFNQYTAIINLLLDCGAACREDMNNQTPLHWAAYHDDTDTLECILQISTEHINTIITGSSFTALHTAADKGYIEAAKFLIKHGANIAIKADGQTPYDVAMVNKHYHVADYLETLADYFNTKKSEGKADVHLESLATQKPPPTDEPVLKVNQLETSCNELKTVNSGLEARVTKLEQTVRPKTNDYSNINKSEVITGKADVHLESLAAQKQPTTDEPVLKVNQLEISCNESKTENSNLETRVTKLEQTVRPKTNDYFNINKSEAGKVDVQCIENNFTYLLENMCADDHLDYLYQEEALTTEDYQVISSTTGNIKKTREMLHRLLRKNNADWVKVLQESMQKSAKDLLCICN